MNILKAISQRWRGLSITTKFSTAFGLFLALIMLVALTNYVTLATVRRHTEETMLTSTQIQRLVLDMDRRLEQARRHERDFFLLYPTIGFTEAQQTFVPRTTEHIDQATALSAELQQLIAASEVSDALRESDADLNLYLSAADRYAVSFGEAVELVALLAAPETGLEAQVGQHSDSLLAALQAVEQPELITMYQQMQSLEKDYWLIRQRPVMQSAFNTALLLRKALELLPPLEMDQKDQALTYLDDYQATAREILDLDVAIRSKRREFDLQAQAIDPVSEELIALAKAEVERARAQIESASRIEMGILAATLALGMMLAAIIALALNNSITHNVIKLTQVAGELQAGNLESRVEIDSGDELGQLAGNFNAMAARINSLVSNLEQKVAERTAELTASITKAKRLNQQLQREAAERQRAQQALEEHSERLEDMVDERTQELRDAQEQLVRQEKLAMLGQVAGSMAHEIRNPLGAIKNAAYFLNMVIEQPDSNIQDMLVIIDKEVGACEKIISSLLDFTRTSPPLQRQVDVNHVVQEALSRATVPENVEVTTQLDEALPSILADPDQLGQVFDNIILNAIQAMTLPSPSSTSSGRDPSTGSGRDPSTGSGRGTGTPNGGQLNIQTLTSSVEPSLVSSPGWVTVSFSDTGVGIPPENLDKLFEPLFTTKAKGIGLGLAIVKSLVEGHGGKIEVESMQKGSTFTIRLPLLRVK